MSNSMMNLMDAYDQVMDPAKRQAATLNKKNLAGVTPSGGKDFVACQEAYDQVFAPSQPQAQPQQHVLTESESKEMQLKRMGAIQYIKESLSHDIPLQDVDKVINSIKEIVSTL